MALGAMDFYGSQYKCSDLGITARIFNHSVLSDCANCVLSLDSVQTVCQKAPG